MSEINNKPEEQHRVDSVVLEIKQKMEAFKEKTKYVGSQALEIRKAFWDDVTVNLDEPDDVIETFTSIKQQAELLSERERSKGLMDKELRTLERLKNSPYFGRIDFKEEGEKNADAVYLGIASLMDEKDEDFLIYDWRAPISSLYYDYSPGAAKYRTPTGIIHGEMLLKRQFIIRDSKIEGMFDTGVTIGDQLLQEVLGNQANTQMKSIVATIQKEQNEIIRNERSKTLVVQGVAGSGKTSAALQRAAFLLYRYRETLNSENIMLFSPNPLFNSYVATVLPELGEENLEQTTYQEYLNNRLGVDFQLEDPFTQMEYILTAPETAEFNARMKSIQYKSSLAFKKQIDQYLVYLSQKGLKFKDISFHGTKLVTKEQIYDRFYSLDPTISIPNRIQLVREWLLNVIKQMEKKERKKEWVEEEIGLLDKEDYLDAFKRLEKKHGMEEDSFDDYELEKKLLAKMVVSKKFKPIKKKIKQSKFIDLKAVYKSIFTISPVAAPESWKEICTLSVEKLRILEMTYEDATPYLYLQDRIEGKKSNTSMRHVFIDEAQDYSAFQFAYIRDLFPYSKMTILGDINQAIYIHTTGSSSIYENENYDDAETFVLTRSYRSTRQIVEFTRELIPGGELIEAFNREGEKPRVIEVNDSKDLYTGILESIQAFQKKGHDTVAIICKTAKESMKAYQVLKEKVNVRLIEKGTLSYESGILIIPSYLAKGIEFDAVIIFDASDISYNKERERKLFYTACTRAMHALHLYSLGEKSRFIKALSNETYDLKENLG